MADYDHKSITSDVSAAPTQANTKSRNIRLSRVLFLFAYHMVFGLASYPIGYVISYEDQELPIIRTATDAALIGLLGSIIVGLVLAPLAARRIPLRPSCSHEGSPIARLDEEDNEYTIMYLALAPFFANIVAGVIGYVILAGGRFGLGLQGISHGLSWENIGYVARVGFRGGAIVDTLSCVVIFILFSVWGKEKSRAVEKDV